MLTHLYSSECSECCYSSVKAGKCCAENSKAFVMWLIQQSSVSRLSHVMIGASESEVEAKSFIIIVMIAILRGTSVDGAMQFKALKT